jgi:hypothetical protein
LDIIYFKPFKVAFRKERNKTMINKNYIKLDKMILARWVDKHEFTRFTTAQTWGKPPPSPL